MEARILLKDGPFFFPGGVRIILMWGSIVITIERRENKLNILDVRYEHVGHEKRPYLNKADLKRVCKTATAIIASREK